jgi:hypothetical protein
LDITDYKALRMSQQKQSHDAQSWTSANRAEHVSVTVNVFVGYCPASHNSMLLEVSLMRNSRAEIHRIVICRVG